MPLTTWTLLSGHSDIEFHQTDPNISFKLTLNAFNFIGCNLEGVDEWIVDDIMSYRKYLSQKKNNQVDTLTSYMLKGSENLE